MESHPYRSLQNFFSEKNLGIHFFFCGVLSWEADRSVDDLKREVDKIKREREREKRGWWLIQLIYR